MKEDYSVMACPSVNPVGGGVEIALLIFLKDLE